MSRDWWKTSRFAMVASMLALAAGVGCASEETEGGAVDSDEGGASIDDIINGDTDIAQTKVARQSIGNCWLYATASWYEGMHKRATGNDLNTSETYHTYWHWFEQIANGGYRDQLSTGGSYSVATGLVERYGIMLEGDFVPSEASAEMSNAQARAETYINQSLKNGALKERSARNNRELVRSELDKAFGLSQEMIVKLNRVFGRAVTRTVDRYYANRRPGYGVIRARDLEVVVPVSGQQPTHVSLADAIGTGSTWSRSGTYAHQEVRFPYNASGHRAFQQRVQRALHDGAIPIMSWKVDFNALTRDSRFSLEELERRGPGSQGGHMVVINDYQATLGDGTVLPAGEDATPEQLQAALADDTSIQFFRVKNSWGAYRLDRWDTGAEPGYHDLEWGYLTGPLWDCPEGVTDRNQCSKNAVGWWDVVVPAGY